MNRTIKLLVSLVAPLVLAIGALPLLTQAQSTSVSINEVAWAGNAASSSDEYIELAGPPGLDLTGWRLEALDGTPGISLTGVISTSGFFLLERTDDDSVASVPADQIYTGALEDSGEALTLRDSGGAVIDEINAEGGWPAGDTSPLRAAMERLDVSSPTRIGSEFVTNDCLTTSGALDADGGTICGSPAAENQPPNPKNTVRFVSVPSQLLPGQSAPVVAQAWNSNGEAPEGSTMRFSIVSTGSQIVSLDPLTATISASGQATVTATGLTTGTAVIVAQWFGNLGGYELFVGKVAGAPGDNTIYLPIIVKEMSLGG